MVTEQTESELSRRALIRAGTGAAAAAAAAAGSGVAAAQDRASAGFDGAHAQQESPAETPAETTDGSGDEGEEGEDDGTPVPSAGDPMAAETLLVMLGLGFLSPILFALLLRWRRSDGPRR